MTILTERKYNNLYALFSRIAKLCEYNNFSQSDQFHICNCCIAISKIIYSPIKFAIITDRKKELILNEIRLILLSSAKYGEATKFILEMCVMIGQYFNITTQDIHDVITNKELPFYA